MLLPWPPFFTWRRHTKSPIVTSCHSLRNIAEMERRRPIHIRATRLCLLQQNHWLLFAFLMTFWSSLTSVKLWVKGQTSYTCLSRRAAGEMVNFCHSVKANYHLIRSPQLTGAVWDSVMWQIQDPPPFITKRPQLWPATISILTRVFLTHHHHHHNPLVWRFASHVTRPPSTSSLSSHRTDNWTQIDISPRLFGVRLFSSALIFPLIQADIFIACISPTVCTKPQPLSPPSSSGTHQPPATKTSPSVPSQPWRNVYSGLACFITDQL